MEKIDTILKRRSIRQYQDKTVSDEQIKELLKAAMAAPSARNMQPWEFYVVTNKAKLDELKTISKAYNYNSYAFIVVCGNRDRKIIDQTNDFYIQDCSAAIENMMLAASMMELGTVWCGVMPVEDRVKAVSTILDLPSNIVPVGIVQVGYPGEEKEARTQYDENKVHYIK